MPASRTPATILSAARRVLASEPRASLDDVATAAGVSRATLYRYYPSRTTLLDALELEPESATRDRILEAAVVLIGRDGLNRLSIDELASEASVSRATVYRLFPGKPALFAALVAEYSPFQVVHETLERVGDQPPEVVLPAVAQAVAHAIEPRIGIIRSLFFELTSGTEETLEGAAPTMRNLLADVGGYLARQMAAGRLRPMHPLLASQAFVGPLFMHLITRPVAKRLAGFDVPLDDAVAALVATTLEGLKAPDLKEALA
jgi:AcrR family transcriptional regulator